MGDATPKSLAVGCTNTTYQEIRAELQSKDSDVWQAELDRLEQQLNPAPRPAAAPQVERGPAVRRGRGLLELFSPGGEVVAASRAAGFWWCELMGNGAGRSADLEKDVVRAKVRRRLASGCLFALWVCPGLVWKSGSSIVKKFVIEIIFEAISLGLAVGVEAPSRSSFWESARGLQDLSGVVVLPCDWSWWGARGRCRRRLLTNVATWREMVAGRNDGAEEINERKVRVKDAVTFIPEDATERVYVVEDKSGRPVGMAKSLVEALQESIRRGDLRLGLREGKEPTTGKLKAQSLGAWRVIDRWRVLFAHKLGKEEKIAIAELRTITLAARHAARQRVSWWKRSICFSDSLPALGALQKGRSGDFGMLRLCRRLCSLTLAVGVRLVGRWVRSEINFLDGPSRGLPLGVADETLLAHGVTGSPTATGSP